MSRTSSGLLPQVQQAQRGMGKAEANSLQVRVELQADCLAGIWANRAHAKWQFIEPGDVEAALQTASAIGDDRLQKQSQGYVVPDAFTHGSSAQRTRWFIDCAEDRGSVPSCDGFPSRRSRYTNLPRTSHRSRPRIAQRILPWLK